METAGHREIALIRLATEGPAGSRLGHRDQCQDGDGQFHVRGPERAEVTAREVPTEAASVIGFELWGGQRKVTEELRPAGVASRAVRPSQ
jgi:hypothetical protein